MSTETSSAPRAKKSVALSGVAAGNTALSAVGTSGHELFYRGYDILDLAPACEFEEVAHLLIHGKLPNASELKLYKEKLKGLRGLPLDVQRALECLPAASHPMDVMRTAVSVLGCVLPEKDDQPIAAARDIADRLVASLGSALLYWYHYSHFGEMIDVQTDDDTVAEHFLHLLHQKAPSAEWIQAMNVSMNLYAEHEFNASTFTSRVITGTGSDMYSAISGAIGALRGPKHGGANEVALEIQTRYDSADEAETDMRARVQNREVIIGFGHPVYTVSDPRNKVIKEVARTLSEQAQSPVLYDVAERIEHRPEQAGKIYFGAWCELENDEGETLRFRIVGDEEVYGEKNYISLRSPMARACLGKSLDDEVTVHTPEGDKHWYIIGIDYQK